ncbi:MAG: MFS transporter permease [Desulfobacteraceae bacterium]|nr:MFS transporter permease [Desulfobacteraceae bacterium]
MTAQTKIITTPKEDAVFWMDKNGIWHNEHGKFEHPKIIRHFNLSIRKDDRGYYLSQITDGFKEKVYFPHEDTALFVVEIFLGKDCKLILNTRETMPLNPTQLFTRNDNLYIQTPKHCIKFSQDVLIKLSKYMEEIDGKFCLRLDHTTYTIPQK